MSNVALTGRRAATVELRERLMANGAVSEEYLEYLSERRALVVEFATGRVLHAEEGDE